MVHTPLESNGFVDRIAAGRALAVAVEKLRLRRPIIVLALPRGGVPVAYEVALALGAPLDVLVVRKIGMPGQPELAIGAIASGGIIVREPGTVGHLPALDTRFEQLARRELAELGRRERAYRRGLPPLDLRGQSVVLVDDGLATGATMLAAVRAARAAGAAFVVVAAPVASDEAAATVGAEADQIAILQVPPLLFAIGAWYRDFDQLDDADVCRLLALAREKGSEPVAATQDTA
ncbi:MAG: phosphoribosyltransferase [Lysobacterales bacterium]|nr:MAG: phosphoribosyltransferase [Xanthomonadales bacterium]